MNDAARINRVTDLPPGARSIFWSKLIARATLLALVLLWGADAMAVEEPDYKVIRTYPNFEVREYAPYLVAETEVKGDFDQVGNQGFRILADYIFGNNVSQTELAMTAPVDQRPAGEKIPMTAPVGQRPDAGDAASNAYVISFIMPSGYSLDTLPAPKDPRVHLREQPARLMAVRRYSGRWTRSNYEKNERILLTGVREAGLEPISNPIYARYNPPFTLWFLRRNEVMVEIRPPAD